MAMSVPLIPSTPHVKPFCHPARERIHTELSWKLSMTQAKTTQAKMTQPKTTQAKMTRKHLLLIDCEEDRRYVTQMGLELMTDWKIWVAHSYSEGFNLAQNQKPHAILVNLTSLEANPLEILQQLLAHPATQHIPIILTLDRLRCVDRQHFNQLGVAGTIAQPYDCTNLGEQIAAFLNWHGDR